MTRRSPITPILLLLTACYTDQFYGEEDQIVLFVDGLTAGPSQGVGDTDPVLEGSTVCVIPCLNTPGTTGCDA